MGDPYNRLADHKVRRKRSVSKEMVVETLQVLSRMEDIFIAWFVLAVSSVQFGSGLGDNLNTQPDSSWQPGPDTLGSGISFGSGSQLSLVHHNTCSLCAC